MMRVLVTGATGYIGGRLIPRLLELGHDVTVLVRHPGHIEQRPWAERVRVLAGDLAKSKIEAADLAGIDAAYYLVHSLNAGADFARIDQTAVSNYIASAQGIPLTIYLGGLLPEAEQVSHHLQSRADVGNELRRNLPTTEFRAGPIIGSGSASFEMVRYLTERLPAMLAPRWIENEVQPIAVRDVLAYLLAALEHPPLGVVEIGADRLAFKEMMHRYARIKGYRRVIVSVPVLAPRIAALWVGLVTPIPNRLAVPLIQGVVEPVIADTTRAAQLFPEVRPIPYEEAVRRALDKIRDEQVETRWSGALGSSTGDTIELKDWQGLMREERTMHVDASAEKVFQAFCSLGGEQGWLTWSWAWTLRGYLDKLVGGPGIQRGRRHATQLWQGEALDFWRVEKVQANRLLRLRAEMRLPGIGWLQYEAVPEDHGTRLVQTALFHPDGLAGTLYWYALYPAHRFIFSGMIRKVAQRAMRSE